MYRSIFRVAAITCLIALGLSRSASAAPITIDSFETPASPLLFIGPSGPPAGADSGAGVLGTRTLSSSTTLGLGDVVAIGNGTFQVFTGTTSMESVLTYNGAGFPLDFSADLGIVFDFLFLDGGISNTTTDFEVTLNTSTGPLTGSVTVSDTAVPFSALLLFASFSGPGNLATVNSIVFGFNNGGSPQQGADFVLDELSVAAALVPEPASLALCGVAGMAALWSGRRRVRKSRRK